MIIHTTIQSQPCLEDTNKKMSKLNTTGGKPLELKVQYNFNSHYQANRPRIDRHLDLNQIDYYSSHQVLLMYLGKRNRLSGNNQLILMITKTIILFLALQIDLGNLPKRVLF